MSVKVSNWAWHDARDRAGHKITGNDLILLLALADVSDDSGRSKYASAGEGLTYDALAEKTGVAKRTIVRIVSRLVEEHLIEYRPGVKGRPNEFLCLIPGAARSGDTLAPNGDSDSVTPVQDSVTTETTFGDKASTRTSYRRNDVTARSSSAVETQGQRFAQPLCRVLVEQMKSNGSKTPETISKRWLDDARLMVDKDHRDPHEAKRLIEWATNDSFWRGNILSMTTFREKYDQLRLKAGSKAAGSTVDQGRRIDAELRRRAAESEQLAVSA